MQFYISDVFNDKGIKCIKLISSAFLLCRHVFNKTYKSVHTYKDRYLLYEQLLAHGDTLVEPLLVFLQEFLLFVDLSPQITVSLKQKDQRTLLTLVM